MTHVTTWKDLEDTILREIYKQNGHILHVPLKLGTSGSQKKKK